jgi:MEDS: MEthanogen/methylotroph, DcmR Sensory domain
MIDPTAFGDGDLSFSWGDHICSIYEDYDQQMTVMLPFMSRGLEAGQRCVWVSSPASAQRLRQALVGIGGDPLTLEASGQLVIIDEIHFYVQDGLFRPDRTLALGRTLLLDGQRQGYPTMRIAADASWLPEYRVDVATWEDYELAVTQRIETAPVVAVCQYSARRLSSEAILAALRSHPIVIMGETVYHNPSSRASFPTPRAGLA